MAKKKRSTTRKKTTRTATRKKAPSRKKTTRKAASKKTTRKAASKKKTTRRTTAAAGDRPRTKAQIYRDIAEDTGLARKDVVAVFDSMTSLIKKDLGNRGPGQFTVPGLMKIKKRNVPRRPARKNVWVPLVQEFRDIPAKPAHKKVRVTPLKGLKELV